MLAQKGGEGGSEEERNSFRYKAEQVLEAMFEERREPASKSGLIVPLVHGWKKPLLSA